MPDLIYAGKTVDELSTAELKACALHFRNAHVDSTFRLAAALRRMTKIEMVLTKEQMAVLDWWLETHAQDFVKGDGTPVHPEWFTYVGTPLGHAVLERVA